eukprot:4385382-Alexandrium_andersonii.AAC.1
MAGGTPYRARHKGTLPLTMASTTRPAPLIAAKAGHSHQRCSGMHSGAWQCGQQLASATAA